MQIILIPFQCNVLIDEEGSACVADYGLLDATGLVQRPTRKPIQWLAPELIDPAKYSLEFRRTKATDVYCFACFCIEVCSSRHRHGEFLILIQVYTGAPPFPSITDVDMIRRVTKGGRPPRPGPTSRLAMSDGIWGIVEKCWTEIPTDRPDMMWAVEALRGAGAGKEE